MRNLLRSLFVRADRLYPKTWWCSSCLETHHQDMQAGWKKV